MLLTQSVRCLHLLLNLNRCHHLGSLHAQRAIVYQVRFLSTHLSNRSQKRVLAIGDRILAGPQSFGRIVTLPDADLAMVQLDHVLAVNGSMVSHGTLSDHTTYVTINNFEWNPAQEYWRPKSSHGDR